MFSESHLFHHLAESCFSDEIYDLLVIDLLTKFISATLSFWNV